jgi:hypothetical protein
VIDGDHARPLQGALAPRCATLAPWLLPCTAGRDRGTWGSLALLCHRRLPEVHASRVACPRARGSGSEHRPRVERRIARVRARARGCGPSRTHRLCASARAKPAVAQYAPIRPREPAAGKYASTRAREAADAHYALVRAREFPPVYAPVRTRAREAEFQDVHARMHTRARRPEGATDRGERCKREN